MTETNYTTEKQQLLLTYLISSSDVFTVCLSIVKPTYFDPEFRNAVEFIIEYFNEYSAIPSPKTINGETGTLIERVQVTSDEIAYACAEVERFCQTRGMIEAVLESADLIQKGKIERVSQLITDANEISISRSSGVDLRSDVGSWIDEMSTSMKPYKLDWGPFDDLIDGGLQRTQLILFTANSGGGKSLVMADAALQLAELHGLHVVYISLELKVPLLLSRFYTMLTGIRKADFQANKQEIIASVESFGQRSGGSYIIDALPIGSSAKSIRAFLKGYEIRYKRKPDVIVLDYLDLLKPDAGAHGDNMWLTDKDSAEEFRQVILDYDAIGITASQQNREGLKAKEASQSHISGGISKINTVDISCAIVLNEQLKAKGEIGFAFTKTRSSDGVGKTAITKWSRKRLRVHTGEEGEVMDMTPSSAKVSTRDIIAQQRNNVEGVGFNI